VRSWVMFKPWEQKRSFEALNWLAFQVWQSTTTIIAASNYFRGAGIA